MSELDAKLHAIKIKITCPGTLNDLRVHLESLKHLLRYMEGAELYTLPAYVQKVLNNPGIEGICWFISEIGFEQDAIFPCLLRKQLIGLWPKSSDSAKFPIELPGSVFTCAELYLKHVYSPFRGDSEYIKLRKELLEHLIYCLKFILGEPTETP